MRLSQGHKLVGTAEIDTPSFHFGHSVVGLNTLRLLIIDNLLRIRIPSRVDIRVNLGNVRDEERLPPVTMRRRRFRRRPNGLISRILCITRMPCTSVPFWFNLIYDQLHSVSAGQFFPTEMKILVVEVAIRDIICSTMQVNWPR